MYILASSVVTSVTVVTAVTVVCVFGPLVDVVILYS